MGICVENVTKSYHGMIYIKDISLEIEDDSFITFLGTTNSGKTTLMRIIAGIDKPDKGKIYYNGKDVTDLPVQKRKIAMVYQGFINYPSLSVYENIASPLRISKNRYSEKEINDRVMKYAEILGITQVLDHYPEEVSGGQQQRTAIARALAKEADYIFLDEPLQNLDYKLREELRGELKTIFRKREGAIIYATPDPIDALSMSTHVGFLNEGRMLAFGLVQQVYNNPDNIEVGSYFSYPSMNIFESKMVREKENFFLYVTDELKLNVTYLKDRLTEDAYFLGIRPHEINIQKRKKQDIEVKARVDLVEIVGSDIEIHLSHHGFSLITLISEYSRLFQIHMGDNISVFLNPQGFFIFSKENRKLVAKTC